MTNCKSNYEGCRCASGEPRKHNRPVWPLWWCAMCARHTQRRDDAPNCYWCGQPYGEDEFGEAARGAFDEWWAEYAAKLRETAEAAWNAARES